LPPVIVTPFVPNNPWILSSLRALGIKVCQSIQSS
jgi:hypothetical protein